MIQLDKIGAQQDRAVLAVATLSVILISVPFIFPGLVRALQTLLGRFYVRSLVVLRPSNGETEEKDKRTVSGLFVHPVKSLRAVEVTSSRIDSRGLEYDRMFMLVAPMPLPLGRKSFDSDEPTHRFLTQRQIPRLATVVAKICVEDDSIQFSTHLLPGLLLNVPMTKPSTLEIKEYLARIWDDVVRVVDMGDEASAFFRKVVNVDDSVVMEELKGLDIRLVQQSPMDLRSTAEKFTPPSARLLPTCDNPAVSLTDGFPILIATEASLAELNRRLKLKNKEEIPMSRFRPNIVVKGTTMEPFEEDRWKVISINGVIFHVVKGCPRCKQSCTDQINGDVYDEPLSTLREFRIMSPQKLPEDAFFAQNVIHAPGMEGRIISIGSSVQVLKWGEPVWGS